MRITRCVDPIVIKNILTHPDVWDWLTDDNSPPGYEPEINPLTLYMVDDEKRGVIRCDPLNSIACSVHIATVPSMKGKGTEFAKKCMEWGFTNTLYSKVVAFIPEYNERTIKLVQRVGFKQEGVLTKSFLKRWKYHDQLIFGLNKEDI